MTLRPLFPYYGSKWRLAPEYPQPVHSTLIEPFAGSAGFSHRYPHLQVELYDLDPTICGVWSYLIEATEREIRNLPDRVVHLDEHPGLVQEARWLIGFWLNRANTKPQPKMTKRGLASNNTTVCNYWGPAAIRRILASQPLIRHWKITNASFDTIALRPACWFVDPPYNNQAGMAYRFNRAGIDFSNLGHWVQSLPGQVICCENSGAQWLPFQFLAEARSCRDLKKCGEVIYYRSDQDAGTPKSRARR